MTEQHKDTQYDVKITGFDPAKFDLNTKPNTAVNGKEATGYVKPTLSFADILKKSRINLEDRIPEPPSCLMIIEDEYERTIGTLGNFMVVTGKAKSRKTFLVSVLAAALLQRRTLWGKIKGCLPATKPKIIVFDTEQAGFHLQRVLRRIRDLTGSTHLPNLEAYCLRPYPPDQRLGAIRERLSNSSDIGTIIIDGIRDTVFDINDPKEATERATDLLAWTGENNIHLITVLHQNKNDTNARGHLGTELVNKAETVLSVARDTVSRDISVVSPEYCRDREFEPFFFSVGEDGIPFLIDAPEAVERLSKEQRQARKPAANNLDRDILWLILKRTFASDTQLSYANLRTSIQEAASHVGHPLSKNTVEQLISRFEKQGFILKAKEEKQRYPTYSLNNEELDRQSS